MGEILNCKVCDFRQKEAPWGSDGKTPSYSICPCCGVEFGYEDSTEEGIIKYRKTWVELGCVWFDKLQMPDGWLFEDQDLK